MSHYCWLLNLAVRGQRIHNHTTPNIEADFQRRLTWHVSYRPNPLFSIALSISLKGGLSDVWHFLVIVSASDFTGDQSPLHICSTSLGNQIGTHKNYENVNNTNRLGNDFERFQKFSTPPEEAPSKKPKSLRFASTSLVSGWPTSGAIATHQPKSQAATQSQDAIWLAWWFGLVRPWPLSLACRWPAVGLTAACWLGWSLAGLALWVGCCGFASHWAL